MREMFSKFTFESFAVGESNRVAWGAAKEVARNPGRTYNPLLIHCGLGLGKSHLLHSIGNYVHEHDPDKKTVLLGADDLRRILELEQTELLGCDVLLVDDLQSLSGEDELQEHFLRLLESLLSRDKQIVLASNAPPDDLSFGSMLLSRIKGGLTVEIPPPDFSLRVEILKSKSKEKDVPFDVLEEIARREVVSVRELEGALNRILAYSAFSGTPFSASLAKDILGKPKRETIRTQPEAAPFRPTEFSHFVSDLKDDLSQAVVQVEDEHRLREEYKQKMYIWEMKGFDVSRLRKAINGTIEHMTGEFLSFTNDVQQLIELQRRFGALDLKSFPEEARSIEERLFNPDLFAEVEGDIRGLEDRIRLRENLDSVLIEGYSFESFLIGRSNMDCFMDCKKMGSLEPEPKFLCVIGGPGVGKTHLLNGIARSVLETNPRKGIVYLDPEALLRGIRTALARRENFLWRYEGVDLFLFDGIDGLLAQGGVQRELVSIIKKLFESNNRVVITTRTPLAELPEALREVLTAGVVREIQSPDPELRVELLNRIASEKGVELREDIIELLSNRVDGNFWDLKEGMDRLLAAAPDRKSIDRELIFRLFPPREEEAAPEIPSVAADRVPVEEPALSPEVEPVPYVSVAPAPEPVAEAVPSGEMLAEEEPAAEPAAPAEAAPEEAPAVAEQAPSPEAPREEVAPSPEKAVGPKELKEKSIPEMPILKERLIDEY